MKILLAVRFALLFLAAGEVLAVPTRPPQAWFQCVQDADCVHLNYSCAGAVVNMAYAKRADEYYALENARSNCTNAGQKAVNERSHKTYCEASICKYRGHKPVLRGFS